jgi:hypothetical protein
MRVYFKDEAKRIGSGWRIVEVMVGRKHVRVMDQTGKRAKFTINEWAPIARHGHELPPRKKTRKKRKIVAAAESALQIQTI